MGLSGIQYQLVRVPHRPPLSVAQLGNVHRHCIDDETMGTLCDLQQTLEHLRQYDLEGGILGDSSTVDTCKYS